MSKMTIGRQVSLACGMLAGFTIAVCALTLHRITELSGAVNSLTTGSLPGLHLAGKLEAVARDTRAAVLAHIAQNSEAQKTKLEAEISELTTSFRAHLGEYHDTARLIRVRHGSERVSAAWDQAVAASRAVIALSRALKPSEALSTFSTEAEPAFKELAASLASVSELAKAAGDKSAADVVDSARSARTWTWGALLSAVVCGGLFAMYIIRSLNINLQEITRSVSECADQVASAASQLSSASQTLAQGVSEQAASLEQTSASSEELSSMTRKNSENAETAAELMSAVDQRILDANRTLEQMMTSMHEITASSDKISKIIQVIDEIAFQTNILALNAAVEAARAGEAGMGFAVVADEVRSLAQRSTHAARDTAELIQESIQRSQEGKTRLEQVASAIRGITDGAAKVKTLVDEVNLGGQEQSRGIEQIAKAINQIEQVTQDSAATAEQSASSGEQLSAMAETLRSAVGCLEEIVGFRGARRGDKPDSSRRVQAVSAGSVRARPTSSYRGIQWGANGLRHHSTLEPGAVALRAKPQRSSFPLDDDFKPF